MEAIISAPEPMMVDNTNILIKGKRTKRPRSHMTGPVAPGAAGESPSASTEAAGSITEEEEDMANCLILLAQGGHRAASDATKSPDRYTPDHFLACNTPSPVEKFTSRRFAEATTTTPGKAGFYVYECKTCNKCFPSFQALGGHRASHKKPKLVGGTDERAVDENMLQISMNSFARVQGIGGVSALKAKVHECSICGAEFGSGQALGGHMRRHRPLVPHDHHNDQEAKKVSLCLDLNLPAPSEEAERPVETPRALAVAPPPGFTFSGKGPLVFSPSASALVDCHY